MGMYVVIREETRYQHNGPGFSKVTERVVVEEIDRFGADAAYEAQTQPGDLFIKCGPPSNPSHRAPESN